jgi:GTPase SAR1 family protein
MKIKRLAGLFAYILSVPSLAYVGHYLSGRSGAVAMGLASTLGAVLFEPIRTKLVAAAQRALFFPPRCRVLVFGHPRSGKTTLIKRILTKEKPTRTEVSTDDFDVFEEELRLGLKNPRRLIAAIADYKGQQPGQLIVEPPVGFFGPKGQRLISAVVFMVDLIPPFTDRQAGVLPDDMIVESYKTDGLALVDDRVKENCIYVNKWHIQEIFELAYSNQKLQSVRLVINKFDLFRKVVVKGYLPGVTLESDSEYAMACYRDVAKEIRAACDQNNIKDFSVHVVSAATGENVAGVLGDVFEGYSRGR